MKCVLKVLILLYSGFHLAFLFNFDQIHDLKCKNTSKKDKVRENFQSELVSKIRYQIFIFRLLNVVQRRT